MEASVMAEIGKQVPALAVLVYVVWIFIKNNERRDEQWRDFLSDQRRQTTEALSRLSAEISTNTAAVNAVMNRLTEHDTWTREAVEGMRASTKKNRNQ